MGLPGIRDLYNRFERVAAPLAEQVVKTGSFPDRPRVGGGVDQPLSPVLLLGGPAARHATAAAQRRTAQRDDARARDPDPAAATAAGTAEADRRKLAIDDPPPISFQKS